MIICVWFQPQEWKDVLVVSFEKLQKYVSHCSQVRFPGMSIAIFSISKSNDNNKIVDPLFSSIHCHCLAPVAGLLWDGFVGGGFEFTAQWQNRLSHEHPTSLCICSQQVCQLGFILLASGVHGDVIHCDDINHGFLFCDVIIRVKRLLQWPSWRLVFPLF